MIVAPLLAKSSVFACPVTVILIVEFGKVFMIATVYVDTETTMLFSSNWPRCRGTHARRKLMTTPVRPSVVKRLNGSPRARGSLGSASFLGGLAVLLTASIVEGQTGQVRRAQCTAPSRRCQHSDACILCVELHGRYGVERGAPISPGGPNSRANTGTSVANRLILACGRLRTGRGRRSGR